MIHAPLAHAPNCGCPRCRHFRDKQARAAARDAITRDICAVVATLAFFLLPARAAFALAKCALGF